MPYRGTVILSSNIFRTSIPTNTENQNYLTSLGEANTVPTVGGTIPPCSNQDPTSGNITILRDFQTETNAKSWVLYNSARPNFITGNVALV